MDFDSLVNEIIQKKLNIYGLEVYKDGSLSHSFGDTVKSRHPIYSATKTILSLAVGTAMDENRFDIAKPLTCYLPAAILRELPGRQTTIYTEISIERLLTMSVCGFPFRPEGESWIRAALQYEIDPCNRTFSYSNVSAYLVGVALANALDEDVYDYLNRKLFVPLEIANPPYRRCPDGYFYGATGMELTVNELSKIGLVLMNGGIYNNRRIVSASYVKDACSARIDNGKGGYGYFIWRDETGFSISGKWGQKCFCMPEKNRMVTWLGDMRENEEAVTELVRKIF